MVSWLGSCSSLYPFLRDQGVSHSSSAQAGVQTGTLKTRSGLALPVHNVSDVLKQIRQMLLSPLAPSRSVIVDAPYATFQFAHPFADRRAIPTQFPFGLALSAFAQQLDHPPHENPPLMPLERSCRCSVQLLLPFTHFVGSILHSIDSVYPMPSLFPATALEGRRTNDNGRWFWRGRGV